MRVFGIYLGIALVMFFYNLFIYFTTRDKNYLYYILYIVFLALTQICLQGYINLLDQENTAYLIASAFHCLPPWWVYSLRCSYSISWT